jgi:hypothetical protein
MTLTRLSRLGKSVAPMGQHPKGFQEEGLGFAVGVRVAVDAFVVLDEIVGCSDSTQVQ